MAVVALQQNVEEEVPGTPSELQLIALRYVGSRPSISPRGALNPQGKWPGTALLNQGSWQFGLVPDEGLEYLERRDDLDVVYPDDRQRFAQALLSLNHLPSNVFGRQADLDLQERVVEPLGLEYPQASGVSWEEQLRKLAGVDEPEDEVDEEERSRVEHMLDEYTRDDLKAAVKALREGADEYNLQERPGKTDMAEFLAGKEADAVHDALEASGDTEDDG